MSFDIILPFLRPIAGYIEDPEVSEIMVNPGGRVFVERHGTMIALGRVVAYTASTKDPLISFRGGYV